MIDLYADHMRRRRRSENTIRIRLYYIKSFNAVRWDLTRATPEDFDRWLHSHRNWSPATVASAVASVRVFYQWAVRAGHIDRDPSVDLTAPTVYRKPQPIVDTAAVVKALETATPTETAILLLGAECGLRAHEIAKLDKRDRNGDWLTIIGKGAKQRTVYVSPELASALNEIERTTMRHTYYFPGRSGTPIHPTTVWRIVRRLLNINPHALRHRAGTAVYQNTGHDIRLAQEFLGHSRPETTAQYLHVELVDLARAGAAARIAA